jgi:hypothetical protein
MAIQLTKEIVVDKEDTREGIKIDKGVILTEDRINKNYDLYTWYINFFTAYPDLFVDMITPKDSNFKLFPYQRIFLRACMRYRYHYCTAPRAFAKSFLSILALYLRCIFLPRSKVFICAPGKEQGTKIAMEKLTELWDLFPILEKEVISKNFQATLVRIVFRNGSVFDIVAAQDAQRGGRRHAGIIDEVRDHDGDMLNSVVLPLMNVNRRTVNGELNNSEPHQAQIYISSAGSKNSYAYERMKELMVNSVIDMSQAFVWGCDYRIPVMAGLIPKTYVSELKMSGTFKEDDFAREYMSIWTGGSSDSWINFDTLVRHRVVVNTEFKAKNNAQKLGYNTEQFYILSIDVARLCAETTICVFKVLAHKNGFTKKLVNLEVLPEKLHFEHQAARIKEMIVAYQPKEVVIDGNGLGVGLMDYMIQYSRHDLTKQVYPPYGSFNDEDYLQKQPRDCQKLIYVMKAGATNQGVINSTCFSELVSGKVHFLIREQDAKDRLLATEKGMKMPIEMRIRKLRPYTLQGILIEEILNMRIKDGNINQNNLTLERINTGMSKDKFSAFEYGLYRIKEHEMQYMKRKSRQKRDLKQFMLFSSRGGGK